MLATISHVHSLTVPDWATNSTVVVANSTGGTAIATASDLVQPNDWNATHAFTIGMSASDLTPFITVSGELSISTAAGGITIYEPKNYVSFFEPFPPLATATMTFAPVVGSFYFDPFEIPDNLSGGHANFFFANPAIAFGGNTSLTSNVTGAATRNQTNYHRFGMYQQVATNISKLSAVWTTEYQIIMQDLFTFTTGAVSWSASKSVYLTLPSNFDTTGGMTTVQFSTANSSAALVASTASSIINAMVSTVANYISGSIMQPVAMTGTIPTGMYWLGYGFSSTSNSAGTNYGAGPILGPQSIMAVSEANLQPYKRVGGSTTNITTNAVRFNGYFSTTSAAPPTTVGTDGMFVSSTTVNNRIYWNYDVLT